MASPCATPKCANKARWIMGGMKSHDVRRLCHSCATPLVETGKFLVLVHSTP
jgi:hypothetical protein